MCCLTSRKTQNMGRWRGVPRDMLAGARVEIAPTSAMPEILCSGNLKRRSAGLGKPVGAGASGWHIECSAMIAHHFGPTIDIHGGGVDLQFPHHENECAQSRCAHNAPLARYWLHNGMLNMAGEKMSKSRGNIKLVDELLADYPGEAVRLALLQGHYRQHLISLPTYWTNPYAVLTGSYGASHAWRY